MAHGFQKERADVEDDTRPVYLVTVKTDENVEKMETLRHQNDS
jgi:hypothetical protein